MKDLIKNVPIKGFSVELNGGELEHLIWLLKTNKLKGDYFGMKDRFERRTDTLISKLGKTFSDGKKPIK